jgi:hypothetical protein
VLALRKIFGQGDAAIARRSSSGVRVGEVRGERERPFVHPARIGQPIKAVRNDVPTGVRHVGLAETRISASDYATSGRGGDSGVALSPTRDSKGGTFGDREF